MSLFEKRTAIFSPCRRWRYVLRIVWDLDLPPLVACMLNPSTADEEKNDPTVERCQRRAVSGGFGSLIVVNSFAYRSTDPKALKPAWADGVDIVGKENDLHLSRVFHEAGDRGGTVFAGWGSHGTFLDRDEMVMELALAADIQLMCLARTRDGQPGHPLYVPYSAPFTPWP